MNIYFTLPTQIIARFGKDLSGIKYDIETIRQPPEVKRLLHALKSLIEQRFKLFEEEISSEEKVSNDSAYILMDFTDHPLEIKYIGYSNSLIVKMSESLTQDDLDYLEKFGNIK